MEQLLAEALSCLTGMKGNIIYLYYDHCNKFFMIHVIKIFIFYFVGSTADVVTVLNENILACLNKLNITFNDITESSHLSRLCFQVSESNDVHWRFICTSCHLLLCLTDSVKDHSEDLSSLCQQKNIRSILQCIVTFGIQPSLIPGVGIPRDKRNQDNSINRPTEVLTELEKYTRLGAVCRCLHVLSSLADLKTIIFTHFLGDYLGALLQLCYAPIAKPNTTITFVSGTFTMTPEIWLKVQTERKVFQSHLNDILLNTYQPSIIKELVILQGNVDPAPPNFMKKALVKHLSICLLSPNGLISTMKCFLDSTTVDTGAQWKHVDLITRLIAVKHGAIPEEEYLINICNQIRNFILDNPNNEYMVVGAACVSSLYQKYTSVKCVNELIKSIIAPLLLEETLPGSTLSASEVNKLIDTLDLCFTHPKLRLPSNFLTPIIYPLFCMRIVSKSNQFLSSKLNNLIINHFLAQSCKPDNWFSSIIFGKSNEEITLTNKNVVVESCSEGINVRVTFETITPSVESSVNCLLDMIVDFQDSNNLACNLFIYLLNIISKSKCCIDSEHNKDSQLLECENIIDEVSENYLIFSKALETLANMECVLKNFKHDPSFIVKFIVQYLEECAVNIEDGIEDSNNDECVNICLILLATLLAENIHNDTLKAYLKRIETSSSVLLNKSTRPEVKLLSKEVIDLLCVKSSKRHLNKSRFDEAISEVCDALLPVRAHGLMQLIKLIEEKDPETVSKKHYVLCIFQVSIFRKFVLLHTIRLLININCWSITSIGKFER